MVNTGCWHLGTMAVTRHLGLTYLMNIACTLWQQVVQLAHFSVHMHRNFIYWLTYSSYRQHRSNCYKANFTKNPGGF